MVHNFPIHDIVIDGAVQLLRSENRYTPPKISSSTGAFNAIKALEKFGDYVPMLIMCFISDKPHWSIRPYKPGEMFIADTDLQTVCSKNILRLVKYNLVEFRDMSTVEFLSQSALGTLPDEVLIRTVRRKIVSKNQLDLFN